MYGTEQIREHMPILCADGNTHGVVDHMDRDFIKVAKDESGKHHWIPMSAVDHVDQHVHLKWRHHEIEEKWLDRDPHPEHQH
ncbi:DUF2171 domain-containing protein [Deinococcus cellulosilyticus]|uniref:DUF2171 domain-containing protein n=1 Tax=Deinococcus cellulosilyticus (strain DSM 18568 / NBRC 106333 / KACC 11606 / 5516J-15) TaxID=1223518 RepID=A0A511N3D6_DEIC1|nr:DUF2171 domain-containing protein [Deinococcus cellulosilyticus]GEM47379.1 hypothetical protein DC3_30140 [Deinococcus cellulosilyticus NBRC 106333 = KACC 11606]